MNSRKVDILNIGLILISLILAFKLPFELFLFSYAVLGPLHYLTEINWLTEKDYFVKKKYWIVVLIVITILISSAAFLQLPIISKLLSQGFTADTALFFNKHRDEMILISFLFAISLVFLTKEKYILLSLGGSIIGSILIFKYVPFSAIIIGVFLPTIIHVYLFTLLFMIFGHLKTRHAAGLIAIILLILCPVIILSCKISPINYFLPESTKTVFMASNFVKLNIVIGEVFGTLVNGDYYLLSESGIKIQIFIAFCYTYHYLNWFSKTSIIGWHKNISKSKLIIILSLWLASVFLYWYDYQTGLLALFFLSFLHVLIEFPLNVTSIWALGSLIKKEDKNVGKQNIKVILKKK